MIRGRIRGHDLGFHFFDAPDDFSRTKLDLMFEGDRLYLHNTQGYFGAVPMSFTGALAPYDAVSQSQDLCLVHEVCSQGCLRKDQRIVLVRHVCGVSQYLGGLTRHQNNLQATWT